MFGHTLLLLLVGETREESFPPALLPRLTCGARRCLLFFLRSPRLVHRVPLGEETLRVFAGLLFVGDHPFPFLLLLRLLVVLVEVVVVMVSGRVEVSVVVVVVGRGGGEERSVARAPTRQSQGVRVQQALVRLLRPGRGASSEVALVVVVVVVVVVGGGGGDEVPC